MSKEFKIFLGYADDADTQIEIIKNLESSIDEYIKKEANELNPQGVIFSNCKYFEWKENASLSTGGQEEKITPDIDNADLCVFIFKSRIGQTTTKEVEHAKSLKKHIVCLFPNQNLISKLVQDGFDDYYKLSEIKEYKKSLTKDWNDDDSKSITPIKEYDNDTLSDIAFENIKKVIKEFYNQQVKEPASKIIDKIDDIEPEKQKINLHVHSKIPQRDRNFVDREEDIKDIIKSIKNHNECMVYSLKGLGGIGKSAITTEICHIFKSTWNNTNTKEYLKDILGETKYFRDGILWIKFEKDISFERHIEILSNSINYKLEYKNNLDELKNKIEDLFYRNDILIILDSAEQNRDNFVKFYNLFLSVAPIIITTREKFDFIDNVKDLNKLHEDDARELFKKYLSSNQLEDVEVKLVDEICLEIDYLPLAIIIMAKMADDIGLKEVKNDVNQKLTYKREILDNGELKSISIEDVFELSYKPLSDIQKRVLTVASIFRYPFNKKSLDNILDNKQDSLHLPTLVNKSLIDKESDSEGGFLFTFHPLMRTFALSHFEKLLDKNSLKKAKEIYFFNIIQSDKDLLKEHIKEVFVILKECNDDDMYVEYVNEINWWLSSDGYWSDRELLLLKAIEKTKKIDLENYFRISLGDVYARNYKFDAANEEFTKALSHFSINNDSNYYLEINYRINAMEVKKNNYKYSYSLNSKFIRESLYLNNEHWYPSFCKNNGWISRVYFKNNLSKYYSLINLIEDIKNIQGINAMYAFSDIIDYLHSYEEYEKVKTLATHLLEKYNNLIGCHSIELSLIDIKIETKDNSAYEELEKLTSKIITEDTEGDREELNRINGKSKLDQNHINLAKKDFKQLKDVVSKNYFLGLCEMKENNFVDAEKYFLITKEFLKSHQNIFQIALVDLEIALIESKLNIESANKILSRCKKVFDEFDFTPKKYYEVAELINGLNIDTSNIAVAITDFFLEKLPNTLKLKDNREMVLVEKGMSFYGKGNQEILTIDKIVEDIEKMFEDENYYKKYEDNIFLYDFYIDKECVSNQEYINYCKSADIKIPSYLVGIKDELLNEPVTNTKLSIEDAKAYAKYYNKVLPLPQEWEKAFRGDSGSLYFKNSKNKDLITSYDMFEITDKHSFSGNENRFRNSSEKYKLIDSFSKNVASKQFIFRCVKPIFSLDDLK